jgi:ABC-type multidrug transport system ATPase subunit
MVLYAVAPQSTLLRALAGAVNPRNTPGCSGELYYNGVDVHAAEVSQQPHLLPSKLAAYLPQSDSHISLLTVRETFRFAYENSIADLSLLGKPEVMSSVEEQVEILMEMMGLDHCADTIIGNDMIRGVSGGQRRRVSVGEQVITNARLLLLDGESRRESIAQQEG